jgi:hypothetical protein
MGFCLAFHWGYIHQFGQEPRDAGLEATKEGSEGEKRHNRVWRSGRRQLVEDITLRVRQTVTESPIGLRIATTIFLSLNHKLLIFGSPVRLLWLRHLIYTNLLQRLPQHLRVGKPIIRLQSCFEEWNVTISTWPTVPETREAKKSSIESFLVIVAPFATLGHSHP